MAKTKKSYSSEKYKARRREAKKLSMRKAREKLKANPELLEQARKKDRERKKEQRRGISEMNSRDQRKQRKKWRQYSKTYRMNVKKREILEKELYTPPQSPGSNVDPLPSTSRLESGKNIRRRERRKLREKMKKLEQENKKLLRQVNKYRKRAYRLEKCEVTTPLKKTREILKGRKCLKEVRKRLLFGEVLTNQLKKNFSKGKKLQEKRNLAKLISGKVVKKYRMLSQIMKITSRRLIYSKRLFGNELKKRIKARRDIEDFLKLDENSRQCPGKRDTITRSKKKMQKRILTDTLINLHKKFVCNSAEYNKLSYSEFCKLRPFWIVSPNCRDRDTCICKIHDNMSLIVTKLFSLNMIAEKNSDEILQAITCNGKLREKCLERSCPYCNKKKIKYHTYNENDKIKYYQWLDKKLEIEIKGKRKKVSKVMKEEIETTKNELVSVFEKQLFKFTSHVCNIKHQYRSIKFIKENLGIDEVLLHMDFSENYSCKYTQEVQSVHFGGSRNQVSLHTSVLYYRKEGTVRSIPFCTISEDYRHNNVAICAHLTPVIKKIKNIVPNLNKIHFVSDGPSNQYRNRKMFILATTFLAKLAQIRILHWHFLEAGHGKGAPDGVGGCLKRTADGIVARGIDIPNIDVLIDQLKINCKGVNIFRVTSAEIDDCDKVELTLPSFTGILKAHEISWTKEEENLIQVRRLTCTMCLADEKCHHYTIGQILIKANDPGDSDSDDHIIDTKIKKARLCYSEVYSDPSDSDSSSSMENSFNDCLKKPKVNDYIIVKLTGKKMFHYYIGLVLQHDGKELVVKFMKKSSGKKFIFPDIEDISSIHLKDIICVLNQPLVNNRQQYEFIINEKYMKLL